MTDQPPIETTQTVKLQLYLTDAGTVRLGFGDDERMLELTHDEALSLSKALRQVSYDAKIKARRQAQKG